MRLKRKHQSRRKIVWIILSSLMLIVTWLLASYPTKHNERDVFLKSYQLDGMNVQEMIAHLESISGEPNGFQASITGQYLFLGNGDYAYPFDLPYNQFYLSIAPYLEQTHPCSNHNLVTCRGELKSREFDVIIKDLVNGEFIVNGTYTSSPQGFFGVWLKQNRQYQITVMYEGYQSIAYVSTKPTDPTCLTTMKLM